MKIKILTIALIFTLLLIAGVSAEIWSCFTKGQKINFCNPATPDRTCNSNSGCQYCMSNYNSAKTCYNQGNYMVCMTLPQQCSGIVDDGSTIDKEPPQITINGPIEGKMYGSRQVIFDLKANEEVSFYYIDNINGRGQWKKISSDSTSFYGGVTFGDGALDITIRAIDKAGNEKAVVRKFSVDSTKPKIKKTYPTRGYANGQFAIDYVEANPSSIVLNYGNQLVGMRTANVNLASCVDIKGARQCNISVDLSSYNNQVITYYFSLTDIGGNNIQNKAIRLSVDKISPVINNNPFWKQDGKYIYFNMSINEKNFEEVSYYDNSASIPRWVRMCSSLKNGYCVKKVTFSAKGDHIVDIRVLDEAGNQIMQRLPAFTIL